MATKHTMDVCLPHGDPDLGAEVDLRITFAVSPGRPAVMYLRNGDPGYPADPAEVEFVSCMCMVNGKPSPPLHAFGDMEQASLDDMATAYLESDEGFAEALEVAASDYEDAREYAADLRADR